MAHDPDPDIAPIHWKDAVKIPAGASPDAAGLAGFFAAQYLSHAKEFDAAVDALVHVSGDVDAKQAAVDRVRAAALEHLPTMHAAWAAAAALSGWKPSDIWAVISEGDGEAADGFTWEWLFKVVDLPETDKDERAFYERLTHRYPEPAPAPPGQYTLNLTPEGTPTS